MSQEWSLSFVHRASRSSYFFSKWNLEGICRRPHEGHLLLPGRKLRGLWKRSVLYCKEKKNRIPICHPSWTSCCDKFDGEPLVRTVAHRQDRPMRIEMLVILRLWNSCWNIFNGLELSPGTGRKKMKNKLKENEGEATHVHLNQTVVVAGTASGVKRST